MCDKNDNGLIIVFLGKVMLLLVHHVIYIIYLLLHEE